MSSLRRQLEASNRRTDQLQTQVEASAVLLNSTVQGELGTVKTEVTRTIDQVQKQMERTRKDTRNGLEQAQLAASRQAGDLRTMLSGQQEAFTQQLDLLKESHNQFGETVNGIQGDVASTRQDLQKTTSNLAQMYGDMGVMSGLIATNAQELIALKQLGDCDYFEFSLPRKRGFSKVGDIQLELRKADTKRNRFTLAVLADDLQVEKKEKTINEPIQFYTSHSRIPYELVVNKVQKDKVVGYLAVPKVKNPLRSTVTVNPKKQS